MRNNKILYFLAVLFVIGDVSCGDTSDKKDESTETQNKLTVEKPSELALLMRSMKQQSISLKETLEKGDSLNFEILEEWKEIHAAEPTQKDKKTRIYHSFADAFLSTVDTLKSANTSQVEYYNMMITACVNCHSELCPGPVPTIQKLIIK